MTQALFTSMTGLNAGTEQLTVVSDNVANMGTTAYKTSRVDFQDIWYQTRTTGTNSTRYIGGTNPYQIGVGVKCSAITKDFGASSVNTTGRAEDLAVQGNGWFTVVNSDGAVFLTRDGNFSRDENGYLCNASGCRLLGMTETQTTVRSNTPIKIPTSIKVEPYNTPAAALGGTYVSQLNVAEPFTAGQFTISITKNDGTTVDATVELGTKNADGTYTMPDSMTVQGIVDSIKSATCSDGSTLSTLLEPSVEDGVISFELKGAAASAAFGKVEGGSNFVTQTNLGSVPLVGKKYTSTLINKSAKVSEVEDITSDTTKTYSEFSVGKDGLVTVKYSDGSSLSVTASEDGTTYFQYIDAEGVVINDDITNKKDAANSPLWVDPNVLVKANMQVQMAKVVNDNGLVARGSNMYEIGVDCGDVIYTVANKNGVGEVANGALETSNVDLAQQFSNMILAQRLVQANSQVFSSANSMLETLVYLGRG